ncbi:tyrosine-protein phosphatase [Nocardioides panacisoli]|uniref:tyrosine-protein phosphatase n=1 Tax=Nocardioides panacisoli TaxID=627624 RepID=UPI001C6396C2|nr:tyrosine-protein phosphatase [Nocardioides panacisoli]QYJ03180.1 tyrosine-protein phosphatase [Nocardioides panacisoli]
MSEHDDVLRLASADNFRDLAGMGARGYATRDGHTVARGVFYRSNELRLTDDETQSLVDLGLRAVLDLRSHPEVERHPDHEIPGAAWHHFDVIGIPMEEVWGLQTREDAVAVMHRVYASFVESEHSRTEFGQLLRQLSSGGPQLFHCSAGKDRTGWAAALLLHVAGVDDATIESDYLLTNAMAAGSRGRVENLIAEAQGEDFVHVLEPTLIADVGYLRTARSAVDRAYGGLDAYLRDGLGLEETTLDRLRSLLRS